jgi:copper oxidase (laccase) domain-containing protein
MISPPSGPCQMGKRVMDFDFQGMSENGLAISGLEGCGEWLLYDFVERHPALDVAVERGEAVERLIPHFVVATERLGVDFSELRTAEQVHGDGIAVMAEGDGNEGGGFPRTSMGVDGLMSSRPGDLLGILVADCCAVYVVDPKKRAIALLHSGKKGTEMGIVPKAIRLMADAYGTRAGHLRIVLSPCIRPPLYEVDFAAVIRRQCLDAGVPAGAIHDSGLCTGSDLGRFYSYRMEKGKTGRMLALLGIRGRV